MEAITGLGKKGAFLVAFIALALISIQLPEIWTQPNEVIFAREGDGLKNVFTPAYYIKYDQGVQFSGMNHPNKELITFTDNQPILSWSLNGLSRWLPIEENVFAIFNWALIFGILLGAVAMYYIFLLFSVPPWLSIWLSLIVCALSPQLDRIDGHFALAYVGFIPMTWLLVLLYEKSKKHKWLLFLAFNIFIQSYIHLYFLPISLLLVGAFVLFRHLLGPNPLTKVSTSNWKLFGTICITAIVVVLSVNSLDTIQDRPTDPYGVDIYTSSLEALFLPYKGPLEPLSFNARIRFEGEAYIGILSAPFFIFFLLYYRSNMKQSIKDNPLISTSLFAAILVFTYSTGWLNDLGLKHLTKHSSSLNQFRSLGRLAWVMYYVGLSTILIAIVRLWMSWKSEPNKYYLSLIPFVALLFWSFDAVSYFKYHTDKLIQPNTFISSPEIDGLVKSLEENNISPNDFQAVMAVPITMLGPEKIQVDRGAWFQQFLMPLSYRYHLPILDIMMSRTSISQALEYLELFTPTYVPKSKLDKIDSRPMLCLYDPQPSVRYENNFIKNKKSIARSPNFDWYTIKKSDLFNAQENSNILKAYSATDSLLIEYNNYNSNNTSSSYAGEGSLEILEKKSLWKGKIPANSIYRASFWIRLTQPTDKLPRVEFVKYGHDDKILFKKDFHFPNEAVAHRQWIRVEWEFDTASENDSFEILVHTQASTVDELLIHKKDHALYSISGSDTLYNNYVISK